MNSLLLWVLLLTAFYMVYVFGARKGAILAQNPARVPPILPTERLAASESKLAPVMVVAGHRILGEILQFDGQLKGSPKPASEKSRKPLPERPSLLCLWKETKTTSGFC
jgi:hypothetical protein